MALPTLSAQDHFAANFSALPSEKTPLFSQVDTLNDEQRLSLTEKAVATLNKITNNISLEKKSGFETHEATIKTTQAVVIHTDKAMKGAPEGATEMDNIKATAIALAMLTQQDSITVTRLTDQRKDDPSLNRGLSLNIGQVVDADMANTIQQLAQDIDPTLEFSVHGEEVRFVNFEPKMNKEFITSVREVAASMPVDTVTMKRFFAEGGKFTNDYERRAQGQDYMHTLSDMGYESLALQVKAAIPEMKNYIQESVARPQEKIKEKPEAVAFKYYTKKDQIGFDFGDMSPA